MSDDAYEMTGFQSACAEFSEKPLSLDERYLTNRPSIFIVEASATSRELEVRKGDKLIIDRSIMPREGDLVLLVISNQFHLKYFSRKLTEGQDPETGDFVWGVIKTQIREKR